MLVDAQPARFCDRCGAPVDDQGVCAEGHNLAESLSAALPHTVTLRPRLCERCGAPADDAGVCLEGHVLSDTAAAAAAPVAAPPAARPATRARPAPQMPRRVIGAAIAVVLVVVVVVAGVVVVTRADPGALLAGLQRSSAGPQATLQSAPTIATNPTAPARAAQAPTAQPQARPQPVLVQHVLGLSTARPGDKLTLSYIINNPDSAPVPAVLQATLRRSSTRGIINDAANDQAVALAPGTQMYQRAFQVPPNAPPGAYDVDWSVVSSDRGTIYARTSDASILTLSAPAPAAVPPVIPTAMPPTPVPTVVPTAVPTLAPAEPPALDPSAVAAQAINAANQVWAGVIARNGRPVSDLDSVYGGKWLTQVHTSVQSMRTKGQYRVARQTAPLLLRTVNQLSDTRVEAFDAEEWSDQLFNADGSLATTYPSHVEQHYIIDLIDGHWLVTQSELVRS